MTTITLRLEPSVALFYARVAQLSGRTLEQVLTDALFKMAGELSLEAMRSAKDD